MESISLEINSHDDLWEIVDKKFDVLLLHKFNPNPILEWWDASLGLSKDLLLENVKVRSLTCDLSINLATLKRILALNNAYFDIYQFNKPVSGSLTIESLPENQTVEILRKNGLEHIIYIYYERIIVNSFSKQYIDSIRGNPRLSDLIIET